MPEQPLVDFLNVLLEAERAGVKVLGDLWEHTDHPGLRPVLAVFRDDEARYCAGLVKLIRKHGGAPSTATGDFAGKVLALAGLRPQLELLNRGQLWVARRIEERLAQVADGESRAFLSEMVERHRTNVRTCEAKLVELPGPPTGAG